MAEKEILFSVNLEVQNSIKAAAEYRKALANLREEQKNLDKTTEEGAIQYELLDQEIKKTSKSLRDTQKVIENTNKITETAAGSNDQLKAKLSLLTQEYNKLSAAERDSPFGRELANNIKSVSDELKATEGGIGNFTRNVGDYENQVANAIRQNGGLQSSFNSLKGSLGIAQNGVLGVDASLFKLAANPIVAAIAAVTTILIKLVTTMKSNEEQSARLKAAFAPLAVVGDAITRVFEGIGDAVLFVLEGFASLTAKITGTTEATEKYMALERERLQLARDTRQLNEDAAQSELEVSELRAKLAQKDLFSAQERINIIDEASAKELALTKTKEDLAKRNLALLEEEASRTKNSAEIEEKLSQARIAVTKATTEYFQKTRDLNKQRATAIAQINAEVKAEQDAASAKTKAAQDAIIKQQELLIKRNEVNNAALSKSLAVDFQTQQEFNQKAFQQQQVESQKLLDLKKQYGKLTQEEYDVETQALLNKQTDFNNSTIAATNAFLESQRNVVLALLDISVEDEIAEIERQYKNGLKALDESLQVPNPLGLSEEEYEKALFDYARLAEDVNKTAENLEKQKNAKIAAIRKNERENQLKDDLLFLEEQLAQDLSAENLKADEIYAIKKAAIERERLLYEDNFAKQRELDEREKQAQTELVNAKLEAFTFYSDSVQSAAASINSVLKAYEDEQLKKVEQSNTRQKDVLKTRLESQLISQEEYEAEIAKLDEELDARKKEIARKQAIRDKALSALSIGVNTGVAIVRAFADAGPIAGIPLAATIGALGAVQLAAVLATPIPEFEDGGLIVGADHSQGGVMINAQGGEAVMTRGAVEMAGPLLSAINVAGGGTPFVGGSGGYVERAGENMFLTYEQTKQAMKEAVQELQVVATIEDIRREDKNYIDVQQVGTF